MLQWLLSNDPTIHIWYTLLKYSQLEYDGTTKHMRAIWGYISEISQKDITISSTISSCDS